MIMRPQLFILGTTLLLCNSFEVYACHNVCVLSSKQFLRRLRHKSQMNQESLVHIATVVSAIGLIKNNVYVLFDQLRAMTASMPMPTTISCLQDCRILSVNTLVSMPTSRIFDLDATISHRLPPAPTQTAAAATAPPAATTSNITPVAEPAVRDYFQREEDATKIGDDAKPGGSHPWSTAEKDLITSLLKVHTTGYRVSRKQLYEAYRRRVARENITPRSEDAVKSFCKRHLRRN